MAMSLYEYLCFGDYLYTAHFPSCRKEFCRHRILPNEDKTIEN